MKQEQIEIPILDISHERKTTVYIWVNFTIFQTFDLFTFMLFMYFNNYSIICLCFNIWIKVDNWIKHTVDDFVNVFTVGDGTTVLQDNKMNDCK